MLPMTPDFVRRKSGLLEPSRRLVRPRLCSMFGYHVLGFGAGGGAIGFRADLIALGLTTGLQVCLDAGAIDSVGSASQTTWNDQAPNAYHLYRGADGTATTDDPTHNGTPGALTSSEYWSLDGGDFFRLNQSNPSAFNDWHKNNAAFTFLVWMYPQSSGGSLRGIIGNNADNTSNVGVLWSLRGSNEHSFEMYNGGSRDIQRIADATVSTGAWTMLGVSWDEAGSTGFLYKNGNYDQVSASNTFSAAYSAPSSSSATYTTELGASGNAANKMPSSTRFAGLMIWSTALSKASIDTVWNRQKTRFGL